MNEPAPHRFNSVNLPKLTPRKIDSHKGSFGHALLIGGATGMTGAIAIAGMSCLRAGAGLVSLGVPEPSVRAVAAFDACFMTIPLACDPNGRLASEASNQLAKPIERANCVAIGPGMGRSADSDAMVETFFHRLALPMILDADALNALSESVAWKKRGAFTETRSPPATASELGGMPAIHRVLTPHPGEWERLCGVAAADRPGQIEAANQIARQAHCVILLKGHHTWITDGRSSFINETGNPSMATGGSGDCLTGIIAGLICQGLSCLDATRLGAHLHGLAGDLAHRHLGTPSTLPTDLIRFLPMAFQTL
jgi:ADP-dependent NAD(P)H-hydrate dehydratase